MAKRVGQLITFLFICLGFTSQSLWLTLPALAEMDSGNYKIIGETVGTSGDETTSNNYGILNVIGDSLQLNQEGVSYKLGGGLNPVIVAHVPTITLSNPDSFYYDRLKFVLDGGTNSPDTLFALAISKTNDFWSPTYFVQANGTLGPDPTWQTVADWGSTSGEYVLGLQADTAYKIKAKSKQGRFTESPYGPESEASTVNPSITFDLDVCDGTHTDNDQPYTINFGNLTYSAVTNENTSGVYEAYLDLTTNAQGGAVIQVRSTNGALVSASTAGQITSSTGTLSINSTSGGYGLAADEETTATLGSLVEISPFDVMAGSAEVGQVTTNWQNIFNTASNPIVDGKGKVVARAIAGRKTEAAVDYTDSIYFLVVPTY